MSDTFSENLMAMQQGFLELYDRFVHIDMTSLKPEQLTGYISDEDADMWLSRQPVAASANVLIFGLSDGKIVRRIIDSCPDDSKVMIYEPSVVNLIYALGEVDLRFCFVRGVRLIVDGLSEDLYSPVMEEMLDFDNYKDYQIYILPGMEAAYPGQRSRFIEHFAREGVGWMEGRRTTERYWLHSSVYNLLGNIRYLNTGLTVDDLKGRLPKDVPYLLIGAGPSLREEVEVLKRMQSRGYMICADTSLKFLLENDIVPDAFVSIEADRPEGDFDDERMPDIPLVCKVNTSHRLMDRHQSIKIYGYDEDAFVHRIYRECDMKLPEYRGGINSLSMAFSILDEIGVETVVLVGQDMCGAGSETHVIDRGETVDGEGNACEIEANDGSMVMSRIDWREMIRWYESALCDTSIKHVINTSLKGAKVRGTEVMLLKEVFDRFGKEREPLKSILEYVKKGAYRRDLDIPGIYSEITSEIDIIEEQGDIKNATKVGYRVSDLLQKYEIADEKDNMEQSVKEGIREIREYIEELRQA